MLDMKFFYIYLKYYNFANYFGFEKLGDTVFDALKNGNISGANQPFGANYENFNLDHQINIQGEGRREVGGGICKSVITQSKVGSRL